MGVIDGLIAGLPKEPIPVRAVVAGIRWTVVTSLGCGLAASCLVSSDGPVQTLPQAGQYHLKSVQELVQGLNNNNGLEASIGLAAYSSTLIPQIDQAIELNAFDLLAQLGTGKNVVMVGHFPQVEWLQGRVGSLKVLEKRPRPGDYPAEAAPDLIPSADVIAITAMTILNHTIDGLLALCPPTAVVIVLGPSAPLTPVLFDYGVDFISGTYVTEEESVLLTIMQGGSALKARGTKKITLCKKPYKFNLPETNSPHGRI
ncbi:MAG: Rossmann-like domain-containing protein [Bellilinea sp.]